MIVNVYVETLASDPPFIPKKLAACFAWFVTPPHRDQ